MGTLLHGLKSFISDQVSEIKGNTTLFTVFVETPISKIAYNIRQNKKCRISFSKDLSTSSKKMILLKQNPVTL